MRRQSRTPCLTPVSGETARKKVCRGWFSVVPVLVSKINALECNWKIKIRPSAIPSESENMILLKSMQETVPHFYHNPILTSSPEKILHDSNVLNLKANQNNGGETPKQKTPASYSHLYFVRNNKGLTYFDLNIQVWYEPWPSAALNTWQEIFFFLHQTLRCSVAEVMSGDWNKLLGPALNANNCMFCMWRKILHDSLLITHSWEPLYPSLHWSTATLSRLRKGYSINAGKKNKQNKQGGDVTKIDFLHRHSFSIPRIRWSMWSRGTNISIRGCSKAWAWTIQQRWTWPPLCRVHTAMDFVIGNKKQWLPYFFPSAVHFVLQTAVKAKPRDHSVLLLKKRKTKPDGMTP